MKTFTVKGEYTDQRWFIVDANEQILGRFSSKIASILRGKHKPVYSPNRDLGDYVVVVNADKIRVTGNKLDQKMYYKHTGYIGHLKSANMREMMSKKPEFVIETAIRKMLPKNILGRKMLKKLKVYTGENHPHAAQKPEKLNLAELR